MVPLGAEGLATRVAMPARGQKRGDLPLHNPLLKPRQEGFGLCKGQPDLLDPLTRLLQDDHIGERLFVTIVVTHDQLDCDLHEGTPPARWWTRDMPIVAEGLHCPQICMLSPPPAGPWGTAQR
jgi:hypothetical protein